MSPPPPHSCNFPTQYLLKVIPLGMQTCQECSELKFSRTARRYICLITSRHDQGTPTGLSLQSSDLPPLTPQKSNVLHVRKLIINVFRKKLM